MLNNVTFLNVESSFGRWEVKFGDHLVTISFDFGQFQLGEHASKMIGGPFCIYVHSAFSAC
jgi:hypothetical protein